MERLGTPTKPQSSDGSSKPASFDHEEENGLTEQVQNSVHDTNSVPNGGLLAWMQVLGGFLLLFNTWGIVNTFGVYQSYYETGELFIETSTTISWIGSIQTFCLLFVGGVTGPIYDAGHFRILLYSGSFLVIFGQMMTSLCTAFWQVLLAQGICMGIGTGLLFVPAVAIISTYFTTKIALAIGFAASGSGMGGVLYPIIFNRLQPSLGFGWTTRVIGFIQLGTLLVPLTVMRVRVLPAQVRKLIDWSALRDIPYVVYTVGTLLGYMGLFVPFFYISYYAIQQKFTNETLGFYMLPILNAASVIGRLLPNFFADKFGVLNTMIPCAFATAILAFCLIAVDSEASIIAVAVLYGFFSGAYVSLPPTIFVFLTPNRALIGTRLGQGFAFIGFGVLISTPVAGAILGEDAWTHVWTYSGVLLTVAAFMFVLVRVLKGEGGVNAGH